MGTFKFCVINKSVPSKTELSTFDEWVLRSKYAIRRAAGSKVKWYGLDTSSLITEFVPLTVSYSGSEPRIRRKA